MTILRLALYSLHEFLEEQSNGPTSEMALMNSSVPTMTVILTYLLIIKILPKFLGNEKPACLTKILAFYDVVQVLGYTMILNSLVRSDWVHNFHAYCKFGIPEENKQNPRMFAVCWYFFLLKFINMFSSSFLLFQKHPEKVSAKIVLYDGLVLMSVWFVVRYMPYWHITYFMLVDTITHIIEHVSKLVAFNLLRMKRKNVAKLLVLVKSIQTFVTFFYTLDAISWNSCNFSTPFCWWLVVQCCFLIISLRNKCGGSKFKERPDPVIENDYSNNVDEKSNGLSLSFARFRSENNLTKRNIQTLRAEV